MHTDYKYDARHESGYGDSETNAFEYANHLRRHWRLIAAASICTVVLSGAVSLMLPKRYTATASIVIEPPAGNDVRTSTAVSPVYLESLRTYERFADSDTLFAGAVERFHLGPKKIESLKQQVLKVTKLRDTRILEIGVTLPEPELAQQVVQYVAQETVKLSGSENLASDRDAIGEAERQALEAGQRLDRVQQAWSNHEGRAPSEVLQSQIQADLDLAARVRQSLIDARGDIADDQEKPDFAPEMAGLRARAAELEKKAAELEKQIGQKGALLSERNAEDQKIESELAMAQTESETAAARLSELRATAGTRGERLRIIDPGIVPQRASSPNIPLNVCAALLLTLMALAVYLTVSFSYGRRRAG